MIYLSFACLLLVACSDANPTGETPRPGVLTKSPTITKTVALEDNGIYLEWSAVETNDNEPARYKVIVWEAEGVTSYHFVESENGSRVLVEDVKQPDKFSHGPSDTDSHKTEGIIDVGSTRSVTIRKLKPGVWYEFRVSGYTSKGEGPRSNSVSFKIPRQTTNDAAKENTKNKYQLS